MTDYNAIKGLILGNLLEYKPFVAVFGDCRQLIEVLRALQMAQKLPRLAGDIGS
jgi:hypothetical protein